MSVHAVGGARPNLCRQRALSIDVMDENSLNVFKKYKFAPFMDRLHVYLRLNLCPFIGLLKFLPEQGQFLDFGSGHGVFAHLMYGDSNAREIIGADPDKKKVDIAKRSAANGGKTSFFALSPGWISEFAEKRFRCITVVDVLYSMSAGEQERLLHILTGLVEDGGVFILKEMDFYPRWKFFWNYIQETISIKLFRLSYGKTLCFKAPEETAAFIRHLGFDVQLVKIDKGYPHPHLAFICKKTEGISS